MALGNLSAMKSKGKSEKGWKVHSNCMKEWSMWTMKKAKVVAHWGFIPLISIVGTNFEPKQQLSQLLTPI